MPYDLNDPNLDFAGQAEILARALKQSQLLQQTQTDQGIGGSGIYARSSPLSGVGAALSRGAGQYNQSQAEASQTALNQEQLKRYDELTRQMSTPGTKKVNVLKRTLGEDLSQGPAMQETQEQQQQPLDYSNPDDLIADNSRRMGIATQMSKLPLAQKTAQDYLSKGAAFPEAIAKMRMEQIERGQQNAVRLEEQARREKEKLEAITREKERDRENRIFLKSLGGGGKDNPDADLDRQIKQARLDALLGKNPTGKAKLSAEAREKMSKEAEENIDQLLGEGVYQKAGGVLPKSTGSGAGALIDSAAGFFGHGTSGAINAAKIAPLMTPILM